MLTTIDFKNLNLPNTPNYYLVCPENYCNNKAETVPIFNKNLAAIKKAVFEVMQNLPRTKLIYQDDSQNKYTFVSRSLIFRFPDYVYIQLIVINPQQTTLAIYSQAKYGYSDFGVNQRRVKNILQQLSKY